MKECKSCKQIKPLEDFHNNKNHFDGKMRQCKICNNARASAWNNANPESNAIKARRRAKNKMAKLSRRKNR